MPRSVSEPSLPMTRLMPYACDDIQNSVAASIPVAAPDSAHRVATTKVKALPKQKASDDACSGITHSDSLFLFSTARSFEQLCIKDADLGSLISPSRYSQNHIAKVGRVDSLASAVCADRLGAEVTLLEPTLRGVTPLRPHMGVIVGCFLVAILIICAVRTTSRTFLHDLLGFFSGGVGWKRLEQTQLVQKNICFFLLNGAFVLMLSVFSVEAAIAFHLVPDGLDPRKAVGVIYALVVLYYLTRQLVDATIGFAFKAEQSLRSISLLRMASCSIIGMLIAPCVLFMPFVKPSGCYYLTIFAVSVIVFVTILRVGKSIRINLTSLLTILYFILYLCIVELAPLACLARVAFLATTPIIF